MVGVGGVVGVAVGAGVSVGEDGGSSVGTAVGDGSGALSVEVASGASVAGKTGGRVAWVIAGWGRWVDVAGGETGVGDASGCVAAAITPPPGSSARCRMNSTRKIPFNMRETARTAPNHLLPMPFSF